MSKHVVRCRSCGAEIFWGITADGKRMPIDAAEVPSPRTGNLVIVWGRGEDPLIEVRPHDPRATHRSHFATCPQASGWRR